MGLEFRTIRRLHLRIALITPPIGGARGNLTTVDRWRTALESLGHNVMCVEPSATACINEADLVHGHQASHTGRATLDLASRLNVPALISLGGTDIHGQHGMCPNSKTRDVLLAADGVIVPNETQSKLVKDLDEEAPPTHIVIRGLPAPTPPPVATPAGGPHIVMVGAIRPVKGQREALEALAKCHELPPTLTVSIVGPIADEEYMNDVRALSKRLNVVRIAEAVPHDEMTAIFEQAHALLNFSRHEGASNAILEAWAAGRAVAATDVPGNHEMLNDAQPAFATLIDPEAPSTLHNWIIELSERTSDDWADCAVAAHRYVNTVHSPKIELEELFDSYKKTLTHS